ncbi:nucleotidyltransferase domain-containing protein [candidate division KSB1 bacterium]|nr:nucleotidyltransferase domain-containing protein [candidate division KSB1 bacterium]
MSENIRQLPIEIGEMVEQIVASFSPERIILFGSYAYGKITTDSDVDLLVIMETDLPQAER